ncbi:DUF1643 domain-containing protein [Cupriavidus basilensis]|uniref:DUF1643 domain-containing protein n=1 Tax=Cupriavidus basilensis TaxID=68895 RepID=A0ABT6AHU5_9BURK|nr:DUF1643 domain-containing protein [Cupriavidus basilensis]MDF3832177.1 DUF1643 domain-containing protein [Cupriavidus basilensis]
MKHLTTQTIDGESRAIVSTCGQYRYRLWREWDAVRLTLCSIMLNPPTADYEVNAMSIGITLQSLKKGLRPSLATGISAGRAKWTGSSAR